MSYPILLSDDNVAAAFGGVDVLPISFYVDRNGVVQEETAGLGAKEEIEAHIRKIVGSATAENVSPAAVGGR